MWPILTSCLNVSKGPYNFSSLPLVNSLSKLILSLHNSVDVQMPLKCILKMINFMFCLFYHTKKNLSIESTTKACG